jgi:hypothetical protein
MYLYTVATLSIMQSFLNLEMKMLRVSLLGRVVNISVLGGKERINGGRTSEI